MAETPGHYLPAQLFELREQRPPFIGKSPVEEKLMRQGHDFKYFYIIDLKCYCTFILKENGLLAFINI